MSAKLATIVADPSRIEDIPASELPHLIGEVEGIKAALWARLQAPQQPTPVAAPNGASAGADELLTAEQAAERLGVNKRWVYRKADELPFTRRLGTGTLRFSAKGLERWKEARR